MMSEINPYEISESFGTVTKDVKPKRRGRVIVWILSCSIGLLILVALLLPAT